MLVNKIIPTYISMSGKHQKLCVENEWENTKAQNGRENGRVYCIHVEGLDSL